MRTRAFLTPRMADMFVKVMFRNYRYLTDRQTASQLGRISFSAPALESDLVESSADK